MSRRNIKDFIALKATILTGIFFNTREDGEG